MLLVTISRALGLRKSFTYPTSNDVTFLWGSRLSDLGRSVGSQALSAEMVLAQASARATLVQVGTGASVWSWQSTRFARVGSDLCQSLSWYTSFEREERWWLYRYHRRLDMPAIIARWHLEGLYYQCRRNIWQGELDGRTQKGIADTFSVMKAKVAERCQRK